MKFPLLMLLPIFFLSLIQAQDTIYTREGTILKARVLQADAYEIDYKKSDLSGARIRTIHTKRVLAIRYQDGRKDVFMAAPDIYRGMPESDYDRSIRLGQRTIKQGIALSSIGGIFLVGGATMFGRGVYIINRYNPQYTEPTLLAVFGALLGIAGMPLSIIGPTLIVKGKKKMRNAEQLKGAISFSPLIAPESSFVLKGGIGMKLNF